MDPKVILITGANSGIGLATAKLLAEKGNKVFATRRTTSDISELEETKKSLDIQEVILDVRDENSIKQAIKTIIDEQGKIDVLINNAGYGLIGPIESVSIEEAQIQFDINVFGVMRMVQAVLPHMRKNRSGLIINVSSIAGICPSPGLPIYSASKAAVESLSETLAGHVAPWNIKVAVVEPGPVKTAFAPKIITGSRKDHPYGSYVKWFKGFIEEVLKEGQPVDEVAELMVKIIESPHPRFRYPTTDSAREMITNRLGDLDAFTNELIQKTGERLANFITS